MAKRFKVSLPLVFQRLKRFRQTGRRVPQPAGGGNRSLIDPAGENMRRRWLGEHSDLTWWQLGARVEEHRGVTVSLSAMSRALRRRGISRQKQSLADPKRPSANVAVRTHEDFAKRSPWHPHQLVFLDEMGATWNLVSHSGRAKTGPRAVGPKPTSLGRRLIGTRINY